MNLQNKHISGLLLLTLLFLCLPATSRESRNIFSTAFDALENKADFFKPGGEWLPYPAYEDRSGWDLFTKGYRKSIVGRGVKALGYNWNNGVGKGISAKNRGMLTTLVFAELAEGQGRFIPKIAELTRALCEQVSLSLNTDRYPDGGTPLGLGTASAAMVLAFPYYYFHKYWEDIDPGLSELVQRRLHEEIFDPFMDPAREQHWMGFRKLTGNAYLNNWNPFCNFQIAVAYLLAEPDPVKVLKGVERTIRSIDRYMDYVALDGSCEEGPSYWNMAGAKVYEFARLMYDVTGGGIDVLDDDQIRLMGEWRSYVEIGDGLVANFSDSGPVGSGSCADIMFRAGVDCHSRIMVDFALYKFINGAEDGFSKPSILSPGEGNRLYRALEALRYMPLLDKTKREMIDRADGDFRTLKKKLFTAIPSIYYPDTQTAFLREGDCYLAAKGGHNTESHNHNDVGSGLFYVNRIPVLLDLGVNHDSYGTSYKKFGYRTKYGIWSVNSDWHNCPAPNGCIQSPGREHCAKDAVYGDKSFSLDIAGAYPAEAHCLQWNRIWTLSGKKLVIRDGYELKERLASDLEYFIVRGDVFLPGDDSGRRKVRNGEVVLRCPSLDGKREAYVRIKYPRSMTVAVESKSLSDIHDMKKSWGDEVKRIIFKSSANAPAKGEYVFEISEINI